MFDLSARLIGIGILLFAAGATGFVPFIDALGVGLLIGALGGVSYRLSVLHLLKPGIAGLIAVAESAAIAFIIAKAGTLSITGVLVLAPCILAAVRHGTRAILTTPVAAASILGAYGIVHHNAPPHAVLLHACAVLMIGVLLEERRRVVVIESEPVLVRSDDLADLELRETFRRLRDAYKALETASRRDRTSVELGEARNGSPTDVPRKLASRLATITGARSVVVYTVASFGSGLVVKGAYGDVSDVESSSSLDVDPKQSMSDLISSSASAVRALRDDESTVASVPLVLEGRVVGLVALSHLSPTRLDEARLIAQDASEEIAALIVEAREREDIERRLREAEILYDLRSLEEGAKDAEAVAKRFSSEIAQMIGADHVGVYKLIAGGQAQLISKSGLDVNLIDDMSFAGGQGVSGWLGTEAPELLLHEVRKDGRCPTEVAVRSRMGSYIVIPLEGEEGVAGFVSAACNTSGGLGREAAEVIRLAALELGRALFPARVAGVMSPTEFHTFIGKRPGFLVQLQPLRRQTLEHTFGRPAVAHCLRRLTGRLRLRLPRGAAICRRTEGDFLVFLPKATDESARVWANETVAYASMIGLRTPDGTHVVPLALRAKVAQLNQQSDEFLQELTA